MAYIELVIKIPEELYESYKGRQPMLGDAGMDMIAQSVANGTPLPKGHGRLIDGDYLYKKFVANKCHDSLVLQFIKDEPTIIEADRGESEDKE